MIHPHRGGGYTRYYVVFAIAAVAIAFKAVLLASGQVAVELQVPWKGIVTLTVILVAVVVSRLRARA